MTMRPMTAVVIYLRLLGPCLGAPLAPQEAKATPEVGGDLNMTVQMIGLDAHGEHVLGHVVKVANPGNRVSLKLPEGRCGVRAFASDTAMAQSPRCKLAINAGYFNVHSNACIGNVVSDGEVLQTVPRDESNVNFGIKDGSFFIGYADPEEAPRFQHLISGVGWLVHQGRSVIETEWRRANASVQTSGKAYISKVASRTAVGFDRQGGLIIVQVDGSVAEGEVRPKGVNMTELANLLVEHGAIEAINLDGGGSSTMVQDGLIINYPSDRRPPSCPASMKYHCQRPVSSILCIQDFEEAENLWEGSLFAMWGPMSSPWMALLLVAVSCSGGFCLARGLYMSATSKTLVRGDALKNGDEEPLVQRLARFVEQSASRSPQVLGHAGTSSAGAAVEAGSPVTCTEKPEQ